MANPKPTHLKIIEGNPGKRKLNKDPVVKSDLKTPPKYLSKEEKKEWNKIISESPKGLLKSVDSSVLEIYIRAKLLYIKANHELSNADLVESTPNGSLMQNPLVGIVNRQAEIMLKACSQMGFTPASRSKVSVGEKEKEEDEFSEFK